MVDKETGKLNVDWDDELISATLLTKGGKIVHPAFAPKPAAPRKRTPKKAGEAK